MKASATFTTFPGNLNLPLYENGMMAVVFSHCNDEINELFNSFNSFACLGCAVEPPFICEHPVYEYHENLDQMHLIIDTDDYTVTLRTQAGEVIEAYPFI